MSKQKKVLVPFTLAAEFFSGVISALVDYLGDDVQTIYVVKGTSNRSSIQFDDGCGNSVRISKATVADAIDQIIATSSDDSTGAVADVRDAVMEDDVGSLSESALRLIVNTAVTAARVAQPA
jgi:hypothetical protein